MSTTRALSTAIGLTLIGAALAAQSRPARSASGTLAMDPDITAIASDAYVFGYPLVSMHMSKRVMTNVSRPENGRAPINQVGALFSYPTAAFKDVVAPNVNTLYNSMWLDVSKEPVVVRMPDTKGRYYVMQILDAWTNVIASPGKRTTGTAMQQIAIAGPGWTGTMPAGVTTTVRSPTNTVWIINRIQANGPSDYAAVNALQRAITTTPVSSYGKPFTWPAGTVDPSVDMKTPVMQQVNHMTGTQFFGMLAQALKENSPSPQDAAIVARMARIGLRPGVAFAPDPAMTPAIDAGAKAGLTKIQKSLTTVAKIDSGWAAVYDCGQFGTNYLTRAVVALNGLGCNLPQDAIYPMAKTDATGQKLNGAHSYTLTFPAGQAPPVKAFWSITMYDADNFLVANSLNRYAISSWMPLKKNPDGSLTLYVQHDSPGADKEPNWLPAPAGDFTTVLRMYWPEESVIKRTWKAPPIKRVN